MNHRLLLSAGAILLLLALFAVFSDPFRSKSSESPNENSKQSLQQGEPRSSASHPTGTEKPRRKARSAEKRRIIYSGPKNLEEWNVKGQAGEKWEYSDGILWSKGEGILAREIPIETRARLRFNLHWEDTPRLVVHFFSDKASTAQPDNAYNLIIRPEFIYVRKRWMNRKSGGSKNMGVAKQHSLGLISGMELEFFFDRESGLIGMYSNGERIKLWRDTDVEVMGEHNWFQFLSADGFPIGIDNIVIEEWDGILPDVEPGQPAFFDPNPERIAELTPPQPWEPLERFQEEKRRLREEYAAAANVPEGPERNAARHAASQAIVRLQNEFNEAFLQLPLAKRVKGKAGYVINPFNGEELDVRGVPSNQRIWDPRAGKPEQMFRLP